MPPFTNFVLDKFIAPKVSELGNVEIPDMSSFDPRSSSWISSFFLNSVFRASWKPPLDVYAYNFLRRAQAAFSEHALARRATLAFIEGHKQSPAQYANALLHWETYLGQSWHAYKILQKGIGLTIYERGSDTVEERLNQLYNQMKHVESRIENGQMPPGATVPVWLTTTGLESVDAALTYSETADVLVDIAKFSTILCDPLEARKHLVHAGA